MEKMADKNKYQVSILGQSYTIVSDEPAEHIQAAERMVDALMVQLTEHAEIYDHKKAAVLAALRLASDVLKRDAEVNRQAGESERLSTQIDQALSLLSL